MSSPLTIPLTGARRVLVDIDRGQWRVAFYQPELEPKEARRLERRAIAGSYQAAKELEGAKVERSTGRGETLAEALAQAWPGYPDLVAIDQISRYVLECRYARPAA